MADRTDELREDIERQRQSIGYTVDQIQNRMSPGRITARGRYRVRRWLIDTKDQVMGNDESEYPWERWSRDVSQKAGDMSERAADAVTGAKDTLSEKAGEMSDRAADAVAGARDGLTEAPAKLRQKTQGNPLAVGLIAFGGGMLAGALLPESRVEGRAMRRVEPALAGAASEAGQVAREIADDVKESAGASVEQVKEKASTAAENVKEEAREAVDRTKEPASEEPSVHQARG
jgi:ElaB/YqjD/DUF883 family membrane-anchored ribosome-binding protein